MLVDFERNLVTGIPHEREFMAWMANLSHGDYDAVRTAIREYISGKDVFTSSFIPGDDWTGTVYGPLHNACGQSRVQSGLFFGLIVWIVIQEAPNEWMFKPSEKDSGDRLGMTYWRRRPQGDRT